MYYNSLFLFDSVSLTWSRVDTRGHIPERRCGHAAAVVDGKIWVFGGRVKVKLGDSFLDDSVTQYRNDLHCYDPGKTPFIFHPFHPSPFRPSILSAKGACSVSWISCSSRAETSLSFILHITLSPHSSTFSPLRL